MTSLLWSRGGRHPHPNQASQEVIPHGADFQEDLDGQGAEGKMEDSLGSLYLTTCAQDQSERDARVRGEEVPAGAPGVSQVPDSQVPERLEKILFLRENLAMLWFKLEW